jgi:formate hydrogenlyase subunit 4
MPANSRRRRFTVLGDSAPSFTVTWLLAALFLFWPCLVFSGVVLVVVLAVWWAVLASVALLAWTGHRRPD